MKEEYIQAYAQLTIAVVYGQKDEDGNPIEKGATFDYKIHNENESIVTFELIDKISTESGYQGYAYKDLTTGEVIVIHEGSQDPSAEVEDKDRRSHEQSISWNDFF